jgi:alpha/beta superfamily hydrolase
LSPRGLPPEPAFIDGPAGRLEAIIDVPPLEPPRGFAVICHPHPQHGGTMQNKVVHTLARAFQDAGYASVRFNYRGVGASQGSYDEGRGETDDALAVIAWARQRWPAAAPSLAGFSFGALVALRAAAVAAPRRLISVAPAVTRGEYERVRRPDCPWLIVQGEADQLVDYREVEAFAARFVPPPELRLLPGVEHFFHGRLPELRALVAEALA